VKKIFANPFLTSAGIKLKNNTQQVDVRTRSWLMGKTFVGAFVLGKLAQSQMAALGGSQRPAREAALLKRGVSCAMGDALRASFQPVMEEPLPQRFREIIEKLRIEEQRQKGL
jgi:hypothetical protein